MSWSYGRQCHLGWGFNESFNQLIPVERDIYDCISEEVNKSVYTINDMSSTVIPYWVSSMLLR